MAEFVMPSLGADMEAGTLAVWVKGPGEKIGRGEVIAEIDTDKGIIEVECFTSGVIEKLLVRPGDKVPVGTPLATIREEATETTVAPPAPVSVPEIPAPVVPPAAAPVPTEKPARLKISPVARRLAESLGLDPATISGTGPGGRVTRADVELAARQKTTPPPVAAAPVEMDRQTRMRQAIAGAMARSKREIPHYYLSATIDFRRALDWLTQENQRRAVADRLLYGVLLIRAVALALREFPELNASWEHEQIVLREGIHVGVAISLRPTGGRSGGLIAPALHDTDKQSLDELMKNFRDLTQRARTGGLRSSELTDATITVTSLGERGVDTVFGVIYPPQVALVGFGKVMERPWVVAGQVVARPLLTATLSADHRVSDGHRGGLFLSAIDHLLQEPEQL